jgi:SAM-dependent methyltransferase
MREKNELVTETPPLSRPGAPVQGRAIAACRICDGRRLEPVIDLGEQPWANHFLRPDEVGTEPFYPLRVVHCADCATAQLDYTVPKEILFGDHTYLSGVTETLSAHFAIVARDVDARVAARSTSRSVLDIGSNDGTQLAAFQALGYDVLGVESSRTTAALAAERGVPTLHAFFNQAVASDIGRRFGVVNAAGVLFHLEELHSVLDGVRFCLAPDGLLVAQCLDTKAILARGAFDQIYHEHLLYYTVTTLEGALRRHGLEVFDAGVSPIHGGSLVVFAGHPGRWARTSRVASLLAADARSGVNERAAYLRLAERLPLLRARDRRHLGAACARGARIFGLGAPVKGNTLLNYFGLGPDTIACLVERNPLRRGLVSPGMHIPVVMEDELAGPPDVYYVLAWNFKREILERHRALLNAGVEFYFPVDIEPA